MEILAIIIKYGMILAVVSTVIYYVVKRAVKDALNEREECGK